MRKNKKEYNLNKSNNTLIEINISKTDPNIMF